MTVAYQIVFVVLFVWITYYLLNKNAQIKAQNERLKQEIKNNAKANKIINNIDAMSSDDVRKRLRELAEKQ